MHMLRALLLLTPFLGGCLVAGPPVYVAEVDGFYEPPIAYRVDHYAEPYYSGGFFYVEEHGQRYRSHSAQGPWIVVPLEGHVQRGYRREWRSDDHHRDDYQRGHARDYRDRDAYGGRGHSGHREWRSDGDRRERYDRQRNDRARDHREWRSDNDRGDRREHYDRNRNDRARDHRESRSDDDRGDRRERYDRARNDRGGDNPQWQRDADRGDRRERYDRDRNDRGRDNQQWRSEQRGDRGYSRSRDGRHEGRGAGSRGRP